MTDTTTINKTEALLAACKAKKGATVEELMTATGQTKQVVTSRVFTLRKAGRLRTVADTKPRRYTSAK